MTIHNPTQKQAEPYFKCSKALALDIETTGLDFLRKRIVMLIIYTSPKDGFIWDVRKKWPEWVNKYLADEKIVKIIQNALFDATWIQFHTGTRIRNIQDTELQERVLQGIRIMRNAKEGKLKELYSASLKYQLKRYKLPQKVEELIQRPGGTDMLAIALLFAVWPVGKPFHKLQYKYGGYDVSSLHKLSALHWKRLKKENLENVARLENDAVEVFIQMRVNGIGFNVDTWMKIAKDYEKERDRLAKELDKRAKIVRRDSEYEDDLPEKINWNSPQQVKDFFRVHKDIKIETFEDLRRRFSKFTMANKDKDLDLFIRFRGMYQCANTFGEKWLKENDKKKSPVVYNGRVHCDYDQIINTGRASCSNPNLQQIPDYIAKERGVGLHRTAFEPSKGCSFVIDDFSGQEFALMMYASKEEKWLNRIRKGLDVHTIMARDTQGDSWVKGRDKKGCSFDTNQKRKCSCPVHQQLRTYSKLVTFGLAYGKGYKTTSEDLAIPVAQAKRIVNAVYREAPKLRKWLHKQGVEAVRTKLSFTFPPYNRRRRLILTEPPYEEWRIKNMGLNTPIQGAGGDMLKRAMVLAQRAIDKKAPAKWKAKILLVVHDEMVTECDDRYTKQWGKLLQDAMETAAAEITGGEYLIKAEPIISKSWIKG